MRNAGVGSGAAAVPGHFDARAATWDESPARRDLTAAVARAVRDRIPLHRGLRVLEYGCGTAALSLQFAPDVAEVVAADASAGMLEQVRRRLGGTPSRNLVPRLARRLGERGLECIPWCTVYRFQRNQREYPVFALMAALAAPG